MSRTKAIDTYQLLPETYRIEDAKRGYPLRAFLQLLDDTGNLVKADIDGLWDDLFVETAADWAVPYVGDLVANDPIHDVDGARRRDVADTVRFRRRKGTLAVVEDVARAVTRLPARGAPAYETLAWTQHVNHVRPHVRLPDVGDRAAMARVGTAFDATPATVDVRDMGGNAARPNLRNVAVHLWPLRQHRHEGVSARRLGNSHVFTFSPLGARTPLYRVPEDEVAGRVGEANVPLRLRARPFHLRPRDDVGRSLRIWRAPGGEVPADAIIYRDLGSHPTLHTSHVAVDVERGLIAFPAPVPTEVRVDFATCLPHDVGGGPYRRARRWNDPEEGEDTIARPRALDGLVEVARPAPGGTPLQAALDAWDPTTQPRLVVQLQDSGTHEHDLVIAKAGRELVIQAADHQRPTLLGNVVIKVPEGAPEMPGASMRVTFDGLLIAGQVRLEAPLARLTFRHCTLVPGNRLTEEGAPASPGAASLDATALDAQGKNVCAGLELRLLSCISGPLHVPAEADHVLLRDTVLDNATRAELAWKEVSPGVSAWVHADRLLGHALCGGPAAAGDADPPFAADTTFERVTVLGRARVRAVPLATDSLFAAPLRVERIQEGCVRFSYVPEGSTTPRRYRCQPDRALEALGARSPPNHLRIAPAFDSTRYGQPAYARLSDAAPPQLREGAEAGVEMGAYAGAGLALRLANLAIRLDEYLPFGFDAGAVHHI